MRLSVWQLVALLPFVVAQDAPNAISPTPGPSQDSPDLILPWVPLPNDPWGFTPFQVPSDKSQPGYPTTDPSSPPPVGSKDIPDFGAAWKDAYQKAKTRISGWSLEEKVSASTGVLWMKGRCVGNIPIIRDWPGLCLEDSPLGVRGADLITSFPAGINAAATWSRDLIRSRGVLMGREHVAKGVNVALGPTMNLGRLPEAGRNWEGFGPDPYLSGVGAYETILGMQSAGVTACAKHLVGNEQEFKRTMSSSEIDDRTMHELYAHPFLMSVMAGVGSIMCSYNLVNGTYACENAKIMNDLAKREYGFQGYIVSDWWAQHSTIAANMGLDMSMPGDTFYESGYPYFGPNLTAYVQNGTIAESRVDDMATRILASWYLAKQDSPSYPKPNFNTFKPDSDADNDHVYAKAPDRTKFVRTVGAASTVLLKNKDNVLPLGARPDKQAERKIVLIGSGAGPGRAGPNEFSDHGGVITGNLAEGWGSGTTIMSDLVSPLAAIQPVAHEHGTSLSWLLDDSDLEQAASMANHQSAALVFIKSSSGEQYITVDGNEGDRNNLTAWFNGDKLVKAVAEQNNNTIVIINSVGPLDVEPWIDHPNVTAVVWAGLAGEESGNSLVDVLYSSWNPSGKLPYTIAKKPEDYPAHVIHGGGKDDIIRIPYSEGLLIDYRHFDSNNIQPRFEFGFGLSYTTFDYSNLAIAKITTSHDPDDQAPVTAWDKGEASDSTGVGSSRAFWLHKPAYEISFDVANTGKVYGADAPQLYVNFPPLSGEPPSVLRGFDNVGVNPGERKRVTFTLSRYDLSIWNVEKQGWMRPEGEIGVSIGASSRDFRQKGVIPV